MGIAFSQMFPPPPSLTESNLSDLQGQVCVVTGGTSGLGLSTASLLLQAKAKVYITARSEAKAEEAIANITASAHHSSADEFGELNYLLLELSDLSDVKRAAKDFLSKEPRLNLLFNNAAVSLPPVGSLSVQGNELQLATNCLGPFLFTHLLLPALENAASTAPPGSVRVVWTSSQYVELSAPSNGIIEMDGAVPVVSNNQATNYVYSKLGNWYLASEFGRRYGHRGLLSITHNPGNLRTNLLRHSSRLMQIAASPLLHNAKKGAYTELWAGTASELSIERHQGAYIIPWGRLHPYPPQNLIKGLRSLDEGGTGTAASFWQWCEDKSRDFW